jgi:hypothetical protein
MNAAELCHLKRAIEVLREIYEEYPEIFTQDRENVLLTAEEIINE